MFGSYPSCKQLNIFNEQVVFLKVGVPDYASTVRINRTWDLYSERMVWEEQ